jgi:hypothetical protein
MLHNFLIATVLGFFFYSDHSFHFDTALSHSPLLQCYITLYYYSAQSFIGLWHGQEAARSGEERVREVARGSVYGRTGPCGTKPRGWIHVGT